MPKFALSIICLALGAATPFAFEPYGLWFIVFATLPAALWLITRDEPKRAFRRAWFFASGFFLHGIYWLQISVSLEMPSWMATCAMVGLCLTLAVMYALPCWLAVKWGANRGITMVVVLPALWVLFEWLRGILFPWLALGYSQTDSPLVGFAPIVGVYGLSLIVLMLAGLCAAFADAASQQAIATRHYVGLVAVVVVMLAGALLDTIEWTQPDGDQYDVALLQGNVPQDQKWQRERFLEFMETYEILNAQAVNGGAELVVWPEVAMAGLKESKGPHGTIIRRKLARLERQAGLKDIAILTSSLSYDYEQKKNLNTMWLLDKSGRRTYHKRYLVPFGEIFPGGDGVRAWVKGLGIPVKEMGAGALDQPLLTFRDKPFNLSICFEDVFGEEIAADMPEAAFIVNTTNDAWFGDSIEPAQHLQIARMRTIETGRYMLRATQTGITAIIDAEGEVVARLPQFEEGVLQGKLHTYTGVTPYSIWRNWLVLVMLAALLLLSVVLGRRSAR